MKKLLSYVTYFILINAAFITDSQAQKTTHFGIQAGLSGAGIYDTDFDTESRIGFLAGFYLNYQISGSPFSIQPEVLYAQKGLETDRDSYKIDYIEIPILARLNFFNYSKLLPYVFFGPHISFKVNADTPPIVVYDSAVIPDTPAVQNSINEGDVNSTDFGITIGAGINFGNFDLGMRYAAGLTKISDDENVSAKNGVLSITTGIEF